MPLPIDLSLPGDQVYVALYGTGIRRTEASLLKVSDIDSQRMVMHIRQGKGSRDRDVPLSSKLLEVLREYWRYRRAGLAAIGPLGPELHRVLRL